MLVRVSAEEVGDAGEGTLADRVHRGFTRWWSPISAISSTRSTTSCCSPGESEGVGRRVLKLLRQWLEAGVMVDGVHERTARHPAGRGDLAVAGQHLPARFDTELSSGVAWGAGALRRRLRGAVPDRGQAEAALTWPEKFWPGWAGAASGQDEGGRPPGRPGGFRLPRLPLPGPHVGPVVGAAADRALLPAPVAVAACDEAAAGKAGPGPAATGSGSGVREVIGSSTRSCAAGETTSVPGTPPTSSARSTDYVVGRLRAC